MWYSELGKRVSHIDVHNSRSGYSTLAMQLPTHASEKHLMMAQELGC